MATLPPPDPDHATGPSWADGSQVGSFRETLHDLPPELADALLRSGQQRSWRRGQTVMRQGRALRRPGGGAGRQAGRHAGQQRRA